MKSADAIRGLYAVTPDTADTPGLIRLSECIVAGGARVLQYRNKSTDAALRLTQASALAGLCRDQGITFIVNDDVELALAVEAHGVHIGEHDGSLARIRQRIGPQRLLGASCYNELERAVAALDAGADHVAFGSFYPSATKPDARRAPLAIIRAAKQQLTAPVVCIGGITLDNAPPLIAAGADAIAVITALYAAADPTRVARQLAQLFDSAPGPTRFAD